MRTTLAIIQAATELDRPDAHHLEAARHRLRTASAWRPPPGTPRSLADALAGLSGAWDAVVAADVDRTWLELLLPVERLGQCDARRVVSRADPEQWAALCIGPGRSVRTAYRAWFAAHGAAPGGGVRSYASRGGR